MIDGQISIFDYETKENKVTKLQQETIDKVLENNTGCEVLLYEKKNISHKWRGEGIRNSCRRSKTLNFKK